MEHTVSSNAAATPVVQWLCEHFNSIILSNREWELSHSLIETFSARLPSAVLDVLFHVLSGMCMFDQHLWTLVSDPFAAAVVVWLGS